MKIYKKLSTALIAAVMTVATLATAGCGKKGTSENVDPTKTTIYVYNYDGGYKTVWLENAAKRYIELQKDVCWEEGTDKKGVDIKIRKDRSGKSDQQIKNGDNDILFLEGVDYFSEITNGVTEDITEVYTTPNKYDGNKKLVEKLNDDQKAYYGKSESGGVKYYGIPSYLGLYGISYNLELFDRFGFYIRKDKAAEITDNDYKAEWFVGENDKAEKSAGPDGVEGTYDDGLPASYTEFFALMKFMMKTGVDPIVWSGAYAEQYITGFINSLVGQNEGAEQFALTYTTDGVATTLGKLVNGQWTPDEDPTVIVDPSTDDGASAKQLARRKGIYDALNFWYRLYNEKFEGKHYYAEISESALTQIQAEKYFISSGLNEFGYKSSAGYKRCAMLIDGMWWESEATDEFKSMEKQNSKYSKANSQYSWMPLPRAEKAVSTDGTPVKNTINDIQNSLCFVKKGVSASKKAVIIDFLQFLHSDDELVEFTNTTGAVKALNYDVSDTDLSKMSAYAQSIVNVRKNSDTIYPAAQTEFMKKYVTTFKFLNLYRSTVNGNTYSNPFTAIKNNGIKAADYFNGIATYYNNSRQWS